MEENKEMKISSESKRAYQEGLTLIYNFFHKKSERIYANRSGNELYEAVSFLCSELDTDIVSYKNLIQTTGENFSIEDIARMSHFPCRSLVLEDGWHKKNCGYILAWMVQEDGVRSPIACIPARWSGYEYFDPVTGTCRKLDDAAAERIVPQAYMIYKPFPDEEMTAGKLVKFGFGFFGFRDRVAYVILGAAVMLISLLLPLLTQMIYDRYIGFGEVIPVVQLCLMILVCNISSLCFGIVRDLAVFRGVTSAKYAVQAAAYDRLFNLSNKDIREYEAADLGNRVSGIGLIFDGLMTQVCSVVLTAICSTAYLVVTVKYSPVLTLYGLCILLVGMLVMMPFIVLQKKYAKKQTDAQSRASSMSYQLIDGVGKIKLAGAENKAGLQYLKHYIEAKQYFMRSQQMKQRISVLQLIISTLLSAAFYWATCVSSADLSMGQYLGFISAFGAFAGAVLGLADAFSASSNMKVLYERVSPVLLRMPDYEEHEQVPEHFSGNIEMSHVYFSYDKARKPVLKDISFAAKPGEYIGIVGPSGCGKSTLMKMLLGFENPDQGKIYFDGYDITRLNKRELRRKMGVVLQDGKIFAGSIYENITLSSPGVGMERIRETIAAVGLESDIAMMPMGIHTYLSESGGTISGGQQQRILIARAILGDPKILLFDEATSALDNVMQDMVCESLEKLQATRIVIAHRLSTIRNCDRILVMDQGQIVEEGSYDQLMEQKGLFYTLASRQIS